MKRLSASVTVLLMALTVLPTSGAVWTDTTSNTGNTISARQPIRVTTYELDLGQFTGTDYTLNLNQPLAHDYFVMIRGSAGDGQHTSRPSSDSVRVTRDPYHLTPNTSTSQLILHRETATMQDSSTADWRGTITVVESPDSQTTDGFILKDVVEIALDPANLTKSTSSGASFTSTQTVTYGGIRGGGVTTTAAARQDYRAQWARFWPSGTTTVSAEGSGIPSGDTSTYSIYVVEWGTNWLIQHAYVAGNNWGNGVNAPGEYDTATIPTSVDTSKSWLVAYGHTTSNRLGGGWQAQVFKLGPGGSSTPGTTNQVSVGAERNGTREVDVYVHTHPRLSVSHIFGADGTIGSNQQTGAVTVAGPLGPESRTGGSLAHTNGTRLAVFANSSNGPGTLYPRSIFWARHESDTSIAWERARTGQAGAFWSQSVDFGTIWR